MHSKLTSTFFFPRYFLLLFILVGNHYMLSAQNVSGVINTYTSVNNIVSKTLNVSNPAGFAVGNTVLIIQMQGAIVDESDTSSFGNVTSYNEAGNYEFDIIASIGGNNITLRNSLCKTYDINGSVQMISVPTYNNVTVTNTLTCLPWNGTTGGVLVLKVSGSLELNADIDVSGDGFRGGIYAVGTFACNVRRWYTYGGIGGGQKGESIATYIPGYDGGRGKWASGGGGGQPGNSGGGGGGNSNAGGLGGFDYSGCGTTDIQGLGGQALSYTNGVAFMGGGGGGGYADNGLVVTPGTNGGGIIIIDADTIVGNDFTIRSNGFNQTVIANDESAGGGGAGGCIVLNTQSFISNLDIELDGGNGGNTYNNVFTAECHAPGGGGATGMLFISQPSLPSNITLSAYGGAAGLVKNPASSCYNTSFGGTNGSGTPASSIIFNLMLENVPQGGIVTAIRDTICVGTPGNLSLSGNSDSTIQWQLSNDDINFTDIPGANRSTYKTIPLQATTWYRAIIGSGTCTAISDTQELFVPPLLTASFNATQTAPNQLTFNSDSSIGKIRSYHWDFGDGQTSSGSNPIHTYVTDTTYYVCLTLYDGSNCSYTFCRYNEVTDAIPIIAITGQWIVYPNPFSGQLTISAKQTINHVQSIEMYDVLGRLVINKKLKNITNPDLKLDVSILASGMYYLMIKTVDADYVQKTIKQ